MSILLTYFYTSIIFFVLGFFTVLPSTGMKFRRSDEKGDLFFVGALDGYYIFRRDGGDRGDNTPYPAVEPSKADSQQIGSFFIYSPLARRMVGNLSGD